MCEDVNELAMTEKPPDKSLCFVAPSAPPVDSVHVQTAAKRSASDDTQSESPKKPKLPESSELRDKDKVDRQSSEEGFANHDAGCHALRLSATGDPSVPQPLLITPKRRLIDLMYVERHPNGAGLTLHAYHEELARLEPELLQKFADKYFHNLFKEKTGRSYGAYCLGVIHGSAKEWPDLVAYLAQCYSNMIVKVGNLEKKHEVVSMTAADYAKKVREGYKNGIMRTGPMHSISLVGAKGEECGGHMPDLLRKLEACPFLNRVTPWGSLSRLQGSDPSASDDGPILWVRPGEQAISSYSGRRARDLSMGNGSLQQLYSSMAGSRGVRQTVITDRTHAHADHADDGFDRHTTAAVGLLRAVRPSRDSRIVKDTLLFDPRHYQQLILRLQLDIMEPPTSQCPNQWLDDAEVNLLRREGFKYTRQPLKDGDIYFIPRGVVHQFKTVSATSSIAWHVRLTSYYSETTVEGVANEGVLHAASGKSSRKHKSKKSKHRQSDSEKTSTVAANSNNNNDDDDKDIT